MANGSFDSAVEWKKILLIAVLLGVIAFGLFSPAISYDFINYDDDGYVYENPQVLNGLSAPGLTYALTTRDLGTWAPLTWLSYQCDTSLLGARPSSYRTTNLLLHAAAGALLFIALQLMVRSLWVSVTVAMIFLFHPLRSESVVWIAERKDVLCAFFWMLGLVAYWHYTEKPGVARWSLLFLCFLAGLLSKMMMATFPCVLLLLDFWPLRRWSAQREDWRKNLRLVIEKLPLLAAALAAILITSSALHSRGALNGPPLDQSSLLLRIVDNYGFYLRKFLWPADLSILYPINGVTWPAFALGLLALVAITALAVWQARRVPWLIVGWLWFLGVLVPVIGLVPFGDLVVADRYSYIPSIGLTLALVMAVGQLIHHFPRLRWTLSLALALACGSATLLDLPRWRNSMTVYDASLRIGPHYTAFNNRGVARMKAGELQAAFADFSAAIQLHPRFDDAYSNRGFVRVELGQYDLAILDLNRAIELNPRSASAYSNRGTALMRKGESEQGLRDYNQCVKLSPNRALYYHNRAAAYLDLKRFPEALADLKKCIKLGGQPHPGLVRAVEEGAGRKL